MPSNTIPNQVFIGCPWRTIRPKYESVIDDLAKKYPLSFVIVGRGDQQDAADLLAVIKERLLSSSYAVFDATYGNANVSLEFGLAEAQSVQRALYLCTHGAGQPAAAKDTPIIADLAGSGSSDRTTCTSTEEDSDSDYARIEGVDWQHRFHSIG